MSPQEQRELERIRYWQGQMLRARDFRTQSATEAQLRWWHNRSLHNVFGVSFGMQASPASPGGPVTAISVSCGLAYDCFGRELVLQRKRQVLAPAGSPRNARSMTLLVRYRPQAPPCGPDERLGACLPEPCSPLEDDLEFVWKASERVEISDGVPLARLTLPGPNWDTTFSPAIARPIARPRLAAGQTIPGNTPWEPWVLEFAGATAAEKRQVGFETRIDTSASGFTEAPRYFASLTGPLWDFESETFFPAFFASVAEASANGFTFRLLMPSFPGQSVSVAAGVATIVRVQTSTEGTRITLDNARPFRVGDALALIEEATGAGAPAVGLPKIINLQGNEIVMDSRIEGLQQGQRIGMPNLTAQQNRIRLESPAGLKPGAEVVVRGVDTRGGPALATAVVAAADSRTNIVTLQPRAGAAFSFRADGLTVTPSFNANFPSEFPAFARRQKLSVCWIGCQEEREKPEVCPGQVPLPNPCDATRN